MGKRQIQNMYKHVQLCLESYQGFFFKKSFPEKKHMCQKLSPSILINVENVIMSFWALSNDCIETVMLVLLWVFQSFLDLFDESLKIFFFKLSETKKSYICPKFNELKKSRKLGFCLESQEVPIGHTRKTLQEGGEVRILGFWSSDVISTKAKYSEFLSSVMSDRRRNSQSSAFAVA